MLRRDAVLAHPYYEPAQNPVESGRPLEVFIDASDFGWAAVLCQRPRAHSAPKIISVISKAFDPTQLRWSAMERELYALWQGVTGHGEYLRGLLSYIYI